MPKTYYLSNALINHALRSPVGSAYARPSGIFVGLFTSPPSVLGGGTEIVGNGYLRQAISLTAPVNGSSSNGIEITFPLSTAPWGMPTHFGIFDAVSGGNLLYWDVLSAPTNVATGKQIVFKANQLAVVET